MKLRFNGKYASGYLFKGISGAWIADVSYVGIKRFKNKSEAMRWMESYGVFDS